MRSPSPTPTIRRRVREPEKKGAESRIGGRAEKRCAEKKRNQKKTSGSGRNHRTYARAPAPGSAPLSALLPDSGQMVTQGNQAFALSPALLPDSGQMITQGQNQAFALSPAPETVPLLAPYGLRFDRWDDTTRETVIRAWQHVLTKSGNNQSATIEAYREAVMGVIDEAKKIIIDFDILQDPLPETEDLVTFMIEHGCFILQVAFCLLGRSKALGYPLNDPMFGGGRDKQEIWITSIFGPRKQIPIIVLQQLMKQSFFVTLLDSKELKRPEELLRKTLFDFLVVPARHTSVSTGDVQKSPLTPLHALWLLLTGPLNSQEEDDDDEDRRVAVSGATELHQAGITFKSNGEKGIRGIQFNKGIVNAVLCLPSILIEPEATEYVLGALICYEEKINKCEVSAYLQFLRQLIRTYHDVKFLARGGIIDVDPRVEGELPLILKRLHLRDDGHNQKLGLVRRQLRVYEKPKWFTYFCRVTVVLAFLQTIFTILAYFHSQK